MTAATSSQLLWYTTRATGIVALVLLSASMVLGLLTTLRVRTRTWPRFTLQDLHRRLSLLAVVFVALHVITTVSDSFAPIGWISVVVPFTSSYRRLWLGLGTVSVDLFLAITVSSLLRNKVNPRTWRTLHWLAYASWPLAVVHGLGTGTDPHLEWVILLVVGCVTAVLAALTWRLLSGWPARAAVRVAAGVTSAVAVIVLMAWTANGPLRPGWAARAGTPRALLVGTHRSGAAVTVPSPSAPPTTAASSLPPPPYRSAFAGTINQQTLSNVSVRIEIKGATSGTLAALIDITIIGVPDGSGGVAMQQGQATFGPTGSPGQYRGQIVGLEGSRLLLSLADQSGSQLELQVNVVQSGSRVTGELMSVRTPASSGGPRDGN
ncbi:MAG TPA: ferric reductase-like transmembrane domain-containing protein [Acidimicrobiales bacterium]|nr:ferric reductase-like transmembrane domain-containing protein [Acidimicrobiales bacterium]